MRLSSTNELFIEAFHSQSLVAIDQDTTYPALGIATFCERLNKPLFDFGTSLVSQLKQVNIHIDGNYYLPNQVANYCLFIDMIFDCLEKNSFFDRQINDLNLKLKPILLKILLNDPTFIQSSRHYLRECLDTYFKIAVGWDQNLGATSEVLFYAFSELLSSVQNAFEKSQCPREEINASLSQLNNLYLQLQKNDRKTCLHEKSLNQTLVLWREVDHFLDSSLNSRDLPQEIILFIHTTWRNVLYHMLSSAGKNNSRWIELEKFTQDLIDHFDADTKKERAAFKLSMIPTIKQTLEKYLINSTEIKKIDMFAFFQSIEQLNMKILNHEAYDTTKAPPLLEENNQTFTRISKAIIEAASKLKSGQALLHRTPSEEEIRCHIADTYTNTDEHLLTNLSGNKVSRRCFVGLGFDLTSKNTQLIESDKLFSKVFSKSLEGYLKRFEYCRKKEAFNEKEKRLLEEKEISLKKVKIEAEELRIKTQKLKERFAHDTQKNRLKQREKELKLKKELETKLLKRERELTEKNEHLRKKLEEEISKNRLNHILTQVKALTIGSWVSLNNDTQESTVCKIAMIYPSSGKILFVDKSGLKVAEHNHNDLVDLIDSQKASIIKQESSFEQSMERIVLSFKR